MLVSKTKCKGSNPFSPVIKKIILVSLDNLSQSRVELLTLRLSGVYSNLLSYWLMMIKTFFYLVFEDFVPGKIRTLNPQIRSLILYPIEPQAQQRNFDNSPSWI